MRANRNETNPTLKAHKQRNINREQNVNELETIPMIPSNGDPVFALTELIPPSVLCIAAVQFELFNAKTHSFNIRPLNTTSAIA